MYDPPMLLSASGVPILSKNQLEHMAGRYKTDCRASVTLDNPNLFPQEFAEKYLHLKIDYQWLGPDGCNLGLSVMTDNMSIPVYVKEEKKGEWLKVPAGTILLDKSLKADGKQHTRNFTLMHENAHNLLHCNYYRRMTAGNIETALCRRITGEGMKQITEWTDIDWMEWQADYLAAAILMPKLEIETWIKEDDVYGYYRHRIQRGVSEIRAFSQIISDMAFRFSVSLTTAKIRLHTIGFDPKSQKQANL